MLNNLASYFEPEHEFYLNSISYERKPSRHVLKESTLNCTESIGSTLTDDGLTIILKRTLAFDPDSIFELSVSFGANLKFVKEKTGEVDWHAINIAEEFRNNGDFILSNLASRLSLLIAEITASFGQSPVVLPPMLFSKSNQ